MLDPLVGRFIRRLVVRLAPLVWVSLAACSSPEAPSSIIAGAWRTAPIPSGSGIDLSLVGSGDLVTGSGHQYNLMYLADSFAATGHAHSDGTFQLTLTFGSGGVGSYAGRLVGANQLDGTLTSRLPVVDSVIFYRQLP
jgi:hypothetical protein